MTFGFREFLRCIFDTIDFRVCYNLHNFGADVTKAVGVKKGQTHIQDEEWVGCSQVETHQQPGNSAWFLYAAEGGGEFIIYT